MSKRIRIKNDIRVSWGITVNKQSTILTSDLSVKLVVFNQVIPITNFTVNVNVITFVFSGSAQTKCGTYTLVCQYEDSSGLHTIDKTEAFTLVPHTEEEGGTNNPNVALEVVRLSTDIDSSTIGKAATINIGSVSTVDYEQGASVSNAGTPNNATLNFSIPRGKDGLSAYEVAKKSGFTGTVSQWLDSLRGSLKEPVSSLNKLNGLSKGLLYCDGSSWSWIEKDWATKDDISSYVTENGLATQAWVRTLVGNSSGSSSGGGVSQSELQAAVKTALSNCTWWGRQFSSGTTTIAGDIHTTGVSFIFDGKTEKKLMLDANGDLRFDGNFYATGGITALGQSSISGGGTSGGSALEIVRTVDETATTLTTAAKKLNFIYPSSWGNVVQNAGNDEVNIRLELLPTGSGSSSGPLANGFFVKCNGEAVGTGFNGNSGMAIDLRAGSGISLSATEDTYYNKKITISATGGGSGFSGVQCYLGGLEVGTFKKMYFTGNVSVTKNTHDSDMVNISVTGGGSLSSAFSLFFYGSNTAGGTPTHINGYDCSTQAHYLKFQGNGVTVEKSTTANTDDTTIVTISGGSGGSSSISWSDITNKPSAFTPSSHTHSASEITNFTSAVQAIKVTSASAADKLANARTIWGQSFNGTANVTGSLSSVTDVNLTGSIRYTSGTSYSNGSMELYHNTPFIDFHYNKSAADYTARLIADGENLLSFLTNSGTGIFDLQNNKLKIGNGYLVWDDTNKSFRMMSSNGGNCNFYCDGGITALGVQSTSTSNSDFTFKNVTADCFKVTKTDNSNIFHLENTKGNNPIVKCYFHGDKLVIRNDTDYITINSVEIDTDGWLYATCLCCDENGVFRADGSYLRLGGSENDANVEFWHDSKGYKLDMSKAISLGIFTQLSTQELSTLEAKVKKKVSA